MKKRCDLLAITSFSPDVVGFLPMSYRVKALLNVPQTYVASNLLKAQKELGVPQERFIYLPGNSSSLIKTIVYLFSVGTLILRLKPKCVIFLHVRMSILSLILHNIPTVLCWNEHPLHLYPNSVKGRFKGIKCLKNIFMRKLLYIGARSANVVMPIGEALIDDLVTHGCCGKRIRLIYLGVDKSFLPLKRKNYKPPNKELKTVKVIYTGSIHKDRGRDLMLDAVALVNENRPKIFLTLVGADEDQHAYCLHRAKQLKIEKHIKVMKRVHGGVVPSLLHSADAGISILAKKSYYRLLPPTKLFENLVAGLPLIANIIETHTYYLQEGITGILFDYNRHSLALAFDRIWRSQDCLPQMRTNAVQQGKKYLWENIEPQFMQAVQDVMRKTPK